jgi:hypothetical protein
MMQLQKTVQDNMMIELRRLMSEKDEIARISNTEHEKASKELENANTLIRQAFDTNRIEHVDVLGNLTLTLQQKSKQILELQVDLEDTQRIKGTMEEKMNLAETEGRKHRQALHVRQMELDDVQTELSSLKLRSKDSLVQLQLSRDNVTKLTVQMTDGFKEKDTIIKKMTTEYPIARQALVEENASLRGIHEGAVAAHTIEITTLRQEMDAVFESLQAEIGGREQVIQNLTEQLEQASRYCANLQASMDSEKNVHKGVTEQLEEAEREKLRLKELGEHAGDALGRALAGGCVVHAKCNEETDRIMKSIRGLVKRKTTHPDDKLVDLEKYMKLSALTVPEGTIVAKFSLRSELLKPFVGIDKTNWKGMWTVLDLSEKIILFYAEKKEVRSGVKGTLKLAEINRIILPDSKQGHFLV